jgi:pimeloyl-ACP methyl ester carboxylesterase
VRLEAIDLGSGPAVVLLHGQPGSGEDWRAVTDWLPESRRVITPDRPGYGRTGGRAVGFRENAAALVELLDRLEVESAVVAGHSWGSGIALATAARFPQRVRALVLVGSVAPTIAPGLVDRALGHRLIGPPASWLGFRATGLGLSLPFMRRLARTAVPALQPTQLAASAAQWRSDDVWRSFYEEQRALIEELPAMAPLLRSIETPTTIVFGTRDRTSPPSHAQALASELPNADLMRVEGAGHLLPQQHPELVAEAIATYP